MAESTESQPPRPVTEVLKVHKPYCTPDDKPFTIPYRPVILPPGLIILKPYLDTPPAAGKSHTEPVQDAPESMPEARYPVGIKGVLSAPMFNWYNSCAQPEPKQRARAVTPTVRGQDEQLSGDKGKNKALDVQYPDQHSHDQRLDLPDHHHNDPAKPHVSTKRKAETIKAEDIKAETIDLTIPVPAQTPILDRNEQQDGVKQEHVHEETGTNKRLKPNMSATETINLVSSSPPPSPRRVYDLRPVQSLQPSSRGGRNLPTRGTISTARRIGGSSPIAARTQPARTQPARTQPARAQPAPAQPAPAQPATPSAVTAQWNNLFAGNTNRPLNTTGLTGQELYAKIQKASLYQQTMALRD